MNKEAAQEYVKRLILTQFDVVTQRVEEAASAASNYAVLRAADLSKLNGNPGFNQAARAEEHNIMMYSTLHLIDMADEQDERVRAVIYETLLFLARVIL